MIEKDKSQIRCQPETVEVSSFDIFGTLLGRKETDPLLRFQAAYATLGLAGKELEALAHLRLGAELKASRRHGPDLYSLANIYDEMGQQNQGAPGLNASACAAELAMEQEQCFATYQGSKALDKAQKSTAILYVTDMYLPATFIQDLLIRNGLWIEGSRLYVSHAEGCAKHSGLFKKILQELGVPPSAMVHFGDNWQADVLAPQKLGIRARYFQDAAPTRYERLFTASGAAWAATNFRFSRLGNFPERAGVLDAAWDTACDVIAPLFIPYVEWVASQAKERNLRKLFFVSRDGLIFKRIYDILKKDQPGWPESRYLYGSRQAWSCVRAAEFTEKDLEFFLFEKTHVSFYQVFRRMGFSQSEISLLGVPEWLKDHLHETANRGDLLKLKQLLLEPFFQDVIRTHAQERVASTQAYLKQEGLCGQEAYGLVDLGWGGNLQSYLDRILHPLFVPAGFYFHLTQQTQLTESGRALGWLNRLPFHGWDAAAARATLEIFCASDHGMTMGYRRSGAGWEPVMGPLEPGGPELALAGVQHLAAQRCAKAWAGLARSFLNKKIELDPPLTALENFKSFMLSPSLVEAETYGDIRLISRQEGEGADIYGPAYSVGMACRSFQKRFGRGETSWPGGIVRRSKGLAKLLVFLRFGLARGKSNLLSFLAPG